MHNTHLYIFMDPYATTFQTIYSYLQKLLTLTLEVTEILTNYSILKNFEWKNITGSVYACVLNFTIEYLIILKTFY